MKVYSPKNSDVSGKHINIKSNGSGLNKYKLPSRQSISKNSSQKLIKTNQKGILSYRSLDIKDDKNLTERRGLTSDGKVFFRYNFIQPKSVYGLHNISNDSRIMKNNLAQSQTFRQGYQEKLDTSRDEYNDSKLSENSQKQFYTTKNTNDNPFQTQNNPFGKTNDQFNKFKKPLSNKTNENELKFENDINIFSNSIKFKNGVHAENNAKIESLRNNPEYDNDFKITITDKSNAFKSFNKTQGNFASTKATASNFMTTGTINKSSKDVKKSNKQLTLRENMYEDYNNTNFEELEELKCVEKPVVLQRNFTVKIMKSIHLFNRFSYIQYDPYVVRDDMMQKIVLRDQLLIVIDKLVQLRHQFVGHDMNKLVEYMKPEDLWKLNRRTEEMIVIVDMLIRQILWDLVDRFSEIGMPCSPLTIKEALKTYTSEVSIQNDNKYLFIDIADYFKDSIESFFVLCRQKEKRTFDETSFNEILQLIERIRYSISTMMGTFRLCNKNKELISTLKKKREEADPKLKKIDFIKSLRNRSIDEENENTDKKIEMNLTDRIKELYKRKICRVRPSTPTRESKVDLRTKTQEGLQNFNPINLLHKKKKTYEIGFVKVGNLKKPVDKLKAMKSSNAELEKQIEVIVMNEGSKENSGRINHITRFISKNL